MKKPKPPKNQIQEVLFSLITRISIDRKQMFLSYQVLNLPEQIRRLRKNHNIAINTTMIEVTNKYNDTVKYGKYSLENKKEAIKVYKSLQNT